MTAGGGVLGILVGAMPGIGSLLGCALLLPLTFKMNPTSAIIMLAPSTTATCTEAATAPFC